MDEVSNIATSLADAAGASAAPTPAPQERDATDPQLKAQRGQLQDLIAKIQGSSLPQSQKDDLIRDLEFALSTGNTMAITNILSRVQTEEGIDVSEYTADTLLAEYYAEEATFDYVGVSRQDYLAMTRRAIDDYEAYSAASKAYIDQQAIHGLQSSPALQDVIRSNQQQPEDVKAHARAEQENNYETQKKLLADPAYDAYDQQLQDMKKFGLLKGPNGHDLLDKIKRHEITPEALQAEIERTKNKQNEQVAPIVQQMVDGLKDKEAKDYLRTHYAKPDGGLDVARMREDFANIPAKDRDDAIQAHLAGKATPEQKRIAMLSQVGFNTEIAVAQQGLMAMMERDKSFAKQMNNEELSDADREKIAAERLRAGGYTVSRASLNIATEGFVNAVDETKAEGVAYGGASYIAALKNNVHEEFQPSLHKDSLVASVRQYENWVAGQAQAQETYVAPEDVLRRYADQMASQKEAPDWVKKDPERYANWKQEQAEWQSLAAHTQEAMAEAAAAPPINTQPTAPKTEAEQAADAAKLKEENPYAALMSDPANKDAFLAANKVAQENNIVAAAPPAGDPSAQPTPVAKAAQQGVGGPGV